VNNQAVSLSIADIDALYLCFTHHILRITMKSIQDLVRDEPHQ
jgi:hypothetical protein